MGGRARTRTGRPGRGGRGAAAFGTDAKSLQAGFAVDAGLRAARLAAAGAQADPAALDGWLELVGGDPSVPGPAALDGWLELVGGDPSVPGPAAIDRSAVDPSAMNLSATDPSGRQGPLIPNGLAITLCPCCYALQRPIAVLAEPGSGLDPAAVRRIVLRTPEATVVPLIHHRPESGRQGKFSLEYAAAAADTGPAAGKLDDCVGDLGTDPSEWTWENVPGVLRRFLSGGERG